MITGLHTNTTEWTDIIAEAMTVALTISTNNEIINVLDGKVNAFYGAPAEVEEINIPRSTKEKVSVWVSVKDFDMEGRESETTGQVVKEGRLFLHTFAYYPKRATKFSEILLKEFGYVTEHGALGMPPLAPWEIGNLEVLKFNPIGGFNSTSEPFGKLFINQQFVNFAVYDKDIADD